MENRPTTQTTEAAENVTENVTEAAASEQTEIENRNTASGNTANDTAEAATNAGAKAETVETAAPQSSTAEADNAESNDAELKDAEGDLPQGDTATEAGVAEDTATEDATAEDGATEDGAAEDGAEAEEEPIEPPMLKVGKEDVPLTAILESLLFVAEVGIKPSQFAQALECPVEDVQVALKLLGDGYKSDGRGLRVQERAGRFTMVTTPIAAKSIEAFLELDLTTKLSGPALEALSVIAYRQPVTRPQIESVRGVDCGGVVKTLLQHEMIEEVGRLDAPGRPILYGITDSFMQHFGLTELQELPPLETTEADILWAATQIAEVGEGDAGEGDAGEGDADDVNATAEQPEPDASTEAAEQPEPDTTIEAPAQPESDAAVGT